MSAAGLPPLRAEQWARAQALFHRLDEAGEAERAAALGAEGDADVAAVVRAMLAQDAAPSPLDAGAASAAHLALDPDAVPEAVGAYRIVGEVGRGGMGVVYLGERDGLDRRVAIKVLAQATFSPARRARFAREQRVLSALAHASIARLYDAGALPDGTPYLVMEHIDGEPIDRFCMRRRVPLDVRLALVAEACRAVDYAHRHGVLHRDVKPSNLLAYDGDAGPAVALLDFGIARSLGEDGPAAAALTQPGAQPMTPAYAAPEQVCGGDVGVPTDVYGLGGVLYAVLTGAPPFALGDATPATVEALVCETAPRPPSRAAAAMGGVARAVWTDLDAVCLQALRKDPGQRYGSAAALAADLERVRVGEPVRARPEGRLRRGVRFVRRYRGGLGVAAAVLVAAAAFGAYHVDRLAAQRDRAEAAAAEADAVSDYLVSLFEASDPYDADTLRVADLLARGAEQAEALGAQPLVQARMLTALGEVYTSQSDFARAETALRRALALRERHAAPPLDRAASLAALGVLFVYTGHDSAAVALGEAARLRERGGAPRADVATTLDDLGVALSRAGHFARADSAYRRALALRRALYDEPHEDLGYSLNNLAVNHVRAGRPEAAEPLYRQALANDRAVFGDDHPNTATNLANLGKLLEDRGDYAAAESLLTDALRVRRAALGETHYETALSHSQLGALLTLRGDLAGAGRHLETAAALREQILGPHHAELATTLTGLAQVRAQTGALAEAEAILRRALGIYHEALGPEHWRTAAAEASLAFHRYRRGASAEAARRYRPALARLEAELGADHTTVARHQSQHAEVLAALGRTDEARPLAESSLARLQAAYPAAHPAVVRAAERAAALTRRSASAGPHRASAPS